MIGATGAIGNAMLHALSGDFPDAELIALSRSAPTRDTLPSACRWIPIDLEAEESIAAAALEASGDATLHGVIIATGLLHDGPEFQPEKSIRHLNGERLQRSFLINAIGPALIGKHFLPRMPKQAELFRSALRPGG